MDLFVKKQRYKYKYNFIESEEGAPDKRVRKRALCLLLYSQGKSSIRFIAKLLKISKMKALRLIRKEAEDIPYPEIDNNKGCRI